MIEQITAWLWLLAAPLTVVGSWVLLFFVWKNWIVSEIRGFMK